jgi:aldehyde dehydrogenase (NAD+)
MQVTLSLPETHLWKIGRKSANDHHCNIDGLYASVFSKNINVALRVARGLQAGNVGVNCTSPYGAYELPFGGFKGSGIGKQKGSNAVLNWTQEKSVYIRHDD